MATFTARIPTVAYGFISVESDDFNDWTEGVSAAQDSIESLFGDAMAAAVKNLKAAGMVSGQSGVDKPNPTADDQAPFDIGPDPLTGNNISVHPTGKYGPFVKADVIASIPKGVAVSSVTPQMAAQWLAKKRG